MVSERDQRFPIRPPDYSELPRIGVTVSGLLGAARWSETLSFELAELKRLSFSPEPHNLRRLEIARRNGSVLTITPTSFEEHDVSGRVLKQAALNDWTFDIRGASPLVGFVSRTTSPLGTETAFSISLGSVRSIVFE